jgi:CRISPR-associated endonuclease Csy4
VNYYIDIMLKPDAEMPPTVLMNAIYAKLHKQLFDLKLSTIGVSFPKYQLTLGNILRLHGTEEDLNKLKPMNWLGCMTGYCKISEVLLVPENAKYRTVSRKQTSMSQAKLNRLLKRGSITNDQIKAYKAKMLSEKGLDHPYLDLVSNSTGQRHRRYIVLGELLNQPVLGEFDQFGFPKVDSVSGFKQATVAWF